MPTFRNETNDNDIWGNIVNNNEYRLPDDLTGVAVIDIGAHIGAFTYACAQRNARIIFAYEPDDESAELLFKNTAEYPAKVMATRLAVWRSDIPLQPMETRTISERTLIDGRINSGSRSLVKGKPAFPAYLIAFDTIINTLSSMYSYDRLLVKLDCEGSEWPILLTSMQLHKVDEIVGEYHEWELPFELMGQRKFEVSDLVLFLSQAGFEVETMSHGEGTHLGMFFAKRKK